MKTRARSHAKNRHLAQKTPVPRPPVTAVHGELLGMDEVIAMLKTTRPTFYRWVRAGRLKGTKAGRQWRFRREDVERFLHGQEPQIDFGGCVPSARLQGRQRKIR